MFSLSRDSGLWFTCQTQASKKIQELEKSTLTWAVYHSQHFIASCHGDVAVIVFGIVWLHVAELCLSDQHRYHRYCPGLKGDKVEAGKLTVAIKHRFHFSSDLQRHGI